MRTHLNRILVPFKDQFRSSCRNVFWVFRGISLEVPKSRPTVNEQATSNSANGTSTEKMCLHYKIHHLQLSLNLVFKGDYFIGPKIEVSESSWKWLTRKLDVESTIFIKYPSGLRESTRKRKDVQNNNKKIVQHLQELVLICVGPILIHLLAST